MSRTEEDKKGWDEYRLSLLVEKSKSDDHFEKYITIIASGALGLTITFIDKISPLENAICIWIISIGWFLMTTTLFINLLSHYIASKNNSKAVQDIDDEKDYDEIVSGINKRNKKMDRLNIASIYTLAIGLCCILIYTSINAYNGKKKQNSAESETVYKTESCSKQTKSKRENDTITNVKFK
ncbi:MAG: hypothetical protein HRU50_10765 [Winogradskyella sp.]|uniref:hypothetical protein n=1 Tax=Winogradskyella sp. TaxID=1883156 RepID=UPI0025E8936A|nr:hypothetical protein [Winogradskyella sp.]NRB60403.1 hypothetical protein [Winogradskyella sp.]